MSLIRIRFNFPANQTVRIANQNYRDSEGNNWPRKIVTISTISRGITPGKGYNAEGIEIKIVDIDTEIKKIRAGQNGAIAGSPVEVFYKENLVYTGELKKWNFEPGVFNCEISAAYFDLKKKLPEGATPYYWGSVNKVKCEKDTDDTYLVSAIHMHDIPRVYDPEGNELDQGTVGWTWENDTNNGKCYIYFPEGQGTYDYVLAEVEGKEINGQYKLEPIANLVDIIGNYTGMQLDITAFQKCETIINNRNHEASIAVYKDTEINEILTNFGTTFDCDWFISRAGLLTLDMYDFSNMTPLGTITKNHIQLKNQEEDPEGTVSELKYMYDWEPYREGYENLPTYTKPTNWPARYDTLGLPYTRSQLGALDTAQRYTMQRKNPPRMYGVVIPLDVYFSLNPELACLLTIDHPDLIEPNRIVKIIQEDISFLEKRVDLELLDINMLTSGFFRLGDREVLPEYYTNANSTQRGYGYLCDRVTGEFSNGDQGYVVI
jgi:hypothetical protein